MIKKIIKGIGLAVLFIAMAYASNWDLPKETAADRISQEDLQTYNEIRSAESYAEYMEETNGI